MHRFLPPQVLESIQSLQWWIQALLCSVHPQPLVPLRPGLGIGLDLDVIHGLRRGGLV